MDKNNVATLIAKATTPADLAKAQATAAAAIQPFGETWPHNGCAANLSALLEMSGVAIAMTVGAADLAGKLEGGRGWHRIEVGTQQPGCVGVVVKKLDPTVIDHIYLFIGAIDRDDATVVDNQATRPHPRSIVGAAPEIDPTSYFLQAT